MKLAIDWDKMHGLIPAVVQDWHSGAVLMLGYMDAAALEATQLSGRVTFYSRSRKQLWTKGDTSGNFLTLRQLALDCDGDALLILAEANGPTCHLGTSTCWGGLAPQSRAQLCAFLPQLEGIIDDRIEQRAKSSYVSGLVSQGTRRIAQKVGEEGVELALAAVALTSPEITEEAADLVFHLLVLLRSKGLSIADIDRVLRARHLGAPSG